MLLTKSRIKWSLIHEQQIGGIESPEYAEIWTTSSISGTGGICSNAFTYSGRLFRVTFPRALLEVWSF